MFAYVGLEMLIPIAVTEKAEVGTGWERGGEDQVGGWQCRVMPKAKPSVALAIGP